MSSSIPPFLFSLLLICLAVLLSPAFVLPVLCDSKSFTQVIAPAGGVGFPARSYAFSFYWAGALWTAGGFTGGGIQLRDVWGSYDLGRTWFQPLLNGQPVLLPDVCVSTTAKAVIYSDSVYLVCDGGGAAVSVTHGATTEATYVSRSPLLTVWETHSDGCYGCCYFNVERMAVPFDGVGTLIMVNRNTLVPGGGPSPHSDVWWQSATGAFQSVGAAGVSVWTPFAVTGNDPFTLPWSARTSAASTTDAEGLVLIMAGGYGGSGRQNDPILRSNEVWQLSWMSSTANPLVYRVAASPSSLLFSPRAGLRMWTVSDWLFLYGGSADGGIQDDVFQSSDYGVTWVLYTSAATNRGPSNPGLGQSNAVTIGRRLFLVSGFIGGSSRNTVNETWVQYW